MVMIGDEFTMLLQNYKKIDRMIANDILFHLLSNKFAKFREPPHSKLLIRKTTLNITSRAIQR